MAKKPDKVTRQWVRNRADEKAVEAGCRFDEERGQFTVDWIEKYCKLYEGDWAGQPLKLMPWARDAVMRMFGWVQYSEQWKREVRRFRQASIWVPKKNGKSPLLAALGLYLLCGDGEKGQKVFYGAKNGAQARKIAGEHTMQMLAQSPDLSAVCSVNMTTYRITHHPTVSFMEPLSSSNTRTQEAQEGINGSVLIDEVHVVDRDFVRRISRAGISRSEPFQIEVSTAGNNPDGYGYERFKYAQEVEQGVQLDHSLFTCIYAVPQDTPHEEIKRHPMKYAKMANPAIGITVDPAGIVDDVKKSQRSVVDWLDCLMYRFNIWQHAANPWIPKDAWEMCYKPYTETDLLGKSCDAGLDLSRTRELSALVLIFDGEEENETLLLPYFWIPFDRAVSLEGKVSMQQWAAEGHLKLIPGGVIDFGVIKNDIRRLSKMFNIRKLAYDPKFAEETTQEIADGLHDEQGKVLVEGTGIERVLFMQNDESFAAPTADFEREIIAGKIRHNGHPVLSWQAGHACVIQRQNKVKRVVKPKADDYRGVDGIIAGIMARAVHAQPAEEKSVYETRGIVTLDTKQPVEQEQEERKPDDDDDDDW